MIVIIKKKKKQCIFINIDDNLQVLAILLTFPSMLSYESAFQFLLNIADAWHVLNLQIILESKVGIWPIGPRSAERPLI